MAVKHKVVERVESKADVRLTKLLRALQSKNLQQEFQTTGVIKICEKVVVSLGSLPLPTDMGEYLHFIENIERVQEILANTCCSNQELIFTTLKAFYNDISNPERQVQPTMSVVLQLINPEYIPTAVKWILHSGYSEQNLEQALKTLCNWLSCWTLTPNLGVLVLHFMQGLEVEQHYEILVGVTITYIERLFKLLILPEHRRNVGPVVNHMLIKVQHSPQAFHKIVRHVSTVLTMLRKENTESSILYLQNLVNLCAALMEHFPGYESLYAPLRRSLEPYYPSVNYLETLNCKPWSDGMDRTVTLFSRGKVGLNNLGNTCYMNSVLQALFMTKIFRNDVLVSSKDAVPLLSKLQVLFALLQHSRRSSLSPADILTLARPPGFQPGHQHDSSEFLGYLLDVLHEQEKLIYTNPGDSTSTVTTETVVQNSFGGRTITISHCGKCGTKSERADNFRELQLSFPNNNENPSVQTLLDYYLQPEPLCGDNQYHCDTCRCLTDGERVTIIAEPPPRLVLTLKHFRYDPVSQLRTKLLQRVKLDAFVQLGEEEYELYAAVVHCGSSVDSGHYYTMARDEQVWYKFNDCVVIQTTEEELCDLRPPETPYILFYSKRDCVDPENLPRALLPARLESEVTRDNAEFEKERVRKQAAKTYATRQNKNDEPPPPGCGGGGMLDNFVNRYVC